MGYRIWDGIMEGWTVVVWGDAKYEYFGERDSRPSPLILFSLHHALTLSRGVRISTDKRIIWSRERSLIKL